MAATGDVAGSAAGWAVCVCCAAGVSSTDAETLADGAIGCAGADGTRAGCAGLSTCCDSLSTGFAACGAGGDFGGDGIAFTGARGTFAGSVACKSSAAGGTSGVGGVSAAGIRAGGRGNLPSGFFGCGLGSDDDGGFGEEAGFRGIRFGFGRSGLSDSLGIEDFVRW